MCLFACAVRCSLSNCTVLYISCMAWYSLACWIGQKSLVKRDMHVCCCWANSVDTELRRFVSVVCLWSMTAPYVNWRSLHGSKILNAEYVVVENPGHRVSDILHLRFSWWRGRWRERHMRKCPFREFYKARLNELDSCVLRNVTVTAIVKLSKNLFNFFYDYGTFIVGKIWTVIRSSPVRVCQFVSHPCKFV